MVFELLRWLYLPEQQSSLRSHSLMEYVDIEMSFDLKMGVEIDEAALNGQDQLIDSTLYRLTQGLPHKELRLVISEADECEKELVMEIEVLEQAIKNESKAHIDGILDHGLTPLDRYWSASSLLGRLRDDLTIPRIPTNPVAPPNPLGPLVRSFNVDAAQLVSLVEMPAYVKAHEQSTHLLALHKRIASQRSAVVFKRSVKPDEAPGYTDRILFPMDLGLLRKMIVSQVS
jgi:hypothetical protein